SIGLELDEHATLISREEYYPYGGTAVWAAHSAVEADTKFIRYSGQERDATGLYDYGWRSYQPWLGRWLNPDPAGIVDGLNLYRMVRNNPVSYSDIGGLAPVTMVYGFEPFRQKYIAENRGESAFIRIDDLNAALDFRERLQKNFTESVRSIKNMSTPLNRAQTEHYNAQADELMQYTGIDSRTEALHYIMSWRTFLAQHADELTFTSLVKHAKMHPTQATPKEATTRLFGFLNKNLPGKLRNKNTELETAKTFGGLLNSADPNLALKNTMSSNSDIGIAVQNSFFRKLSKLGLDWAQSESDINLVFVEGAFTSSVNESPADALNERNWRKFTSEDEANLDARSYRVARRTAAYFPITYSEMRHARKKRYDIHRVSIIS
ncbi:RHS repeat-associated core domain-containing protein, partial [Burkholderia ubonensis]|uniref:RHS repeat-associated core domain-containing protein n=1 Tax=Burkholderia ubonensis TaxID=101571 RepID=UPI000AA74813